MEIVCKEESYRIIGACLADEHKSQVVNYLKATGGPLGLLVNFGHYPKIEHERFVNQSSPNAFGEDFSRLSRVS